MRQLISRAMIMLRSIVGIGAILFAIWLVDHRQILPHADCLLGIAVGVFLLSSTVAFLGYLQLRDSRRMQPGPHAIVRSQHDREGSVYDLRAGQSYRILQPFTDYHGRLFTQGDILIFKESHFLPYHGGHTLIFDKQIIYLQEELHADILANFSAYIAKVA